MKNKIEIYKLSSTAFLMALAILFSRIPFLSTYINIGGVNLVKIGFQEIPLMIACLFNGPMYSMIASFGADLLAATLFPTGGAYFPGFTLDAIFLGLVPAIVIKYSRNNNKITSFIFILITVFTFIMNYSLLVNIDNVKIGGFNFENNILWKIFIPIIILLISVIYYVLVFFINNKKTFFKNYDIFIIYYVRDILIAPILVPIWMDILYKMPYSISYISQLSSKLITLPILVIITAIIVVPLEKINANLLKETYCEKKYLYTKVVNGKKII